MKNVLILGAGLVANPMVRYLLSENIRVTVASNTPDRASEMVAGHPYGTVVPWEADDETTLDHLVQSHDLTVSLLPYLFHVMVAKHCIAHSRNMVTTSYVKPEMQALDQEARDAGIIILNEIGLDPGIDHMSAMRIIDHIHQKEGAVLEFYSICGALPAPEAAGNPFRYKFSWSPKGVVMAGNNDARFLKDGKMVSIPTQELFRNQFSVDFPPAGTLEVYPTRDSMAYQSIYRIPEARTVFRGTFRYPGWCSNLDFIKRLDLISYDTTDMTGMTYRDLLMHQIRKAALNDPFFTQPQRFQNSDPFRALEWLGFESNEPMHRSMDSTFGVTSDLMISRMGMSPDERDMVVMQHTFLAAWSDGRKEVIRSRMLDFGQPGGDTSVARTVALPAAIGVEMILGGKITEKGVHIPVIPSIYEPVLNQLEKMGIKMEEEFGLPLSENIS